MARQSATSPDNSAREVTSGRSPIAPQPAGIAITFGWTNVGFSKKHGFMLVEILLVSHGGKKNHTIATIEKKVAGFTKE
jgi:hypothetical protein